ncbi:MAG: bifunctional UDP-N-acetylmuramoyl-tripeptide:D-alanyl-D-alanine ligase/alanine racemase [Bacteroidia bacterium]|nr:bifunctional UDP-N-acetylmuramoyl-tripeptide:D-alanyl-D-alanine ligase/alanine racemase [Bacteroidia bacterium]
MLGVPYNITEIAQASFAKDLHQGTFRAPVLKYISFDSRLISHGSQSLFVALKTGNRDGHDYLEDAYKKGVRNFIVEKELGFKGVNYALVDDSLEALQLLAMQHRSRFSYPIWAITGSNGKTTVKEWLASLLEIEFQLVKSPMSYNSQLGVALSLLQLRPGIDLAIIEAGISQPGEMEVLAQMIKPTHGILTHMGSSHAENFEGMDHKLEEKLKLFEGVEQLLCSSFQPEILRKVEDLNPLSIGFQDTDHWKISQTSLSDSFLINDNDLKEAIKLPFSGQGNAENAWLAIAAARSIGLSFESIKERLPFLSPVEMRTEIISDNPEITLINDSYNSDVDSVRNAFQQLDDTDIHPRKWIIISDIPHLGEQQEAIQQEVLEEAESLVGAEHIISIGPVFGKLRSEKHYDRVEDFLAKLKVREFFNSTILLKGARNFALEKLIPRFNHKLNATTFTIDLSALSHNFRYLKSRVAEGTKAMCMVKAASYGSGTWEIAQQLEKEGASYLAVAYASEGIELRQAGIQLPIMVLNPDLSSVEALLQFDIEPEVSNFPLLRGFLRAARLSERSEYRIHIKLDTGMGRLGFTESDLEALVLELGKEPDVNIISLMSHMAAADIPEEDEFSRSQIRTFLRMSQYLQTQLGIQPFRHILNTPGILRFPEAAFDMVRLGIGLYGINPVEELHDLKEIGSLVSNISQIHNYPEGVSIGYGRSQYTRRPSRIATVPIGYADGIPRSVGGGKASFLVHGKRVPTFGRICMDMLMLDVSDLPKAAEGDKVLIFGHLGEDSLSINELAKAAETIPYELLVRVSPRVRRVYVKE